MTNEPNDGWGENIPEAVASAEATENILRAIREEGIRYYHTRNRHAFLLVLGLETTRSARSRVGWVE